MIRAAIFACLAVPIAAETAPRVFVEGGNVLINDGGARKPLTRSGRDSDPALSPDGRFVVFTREPETKPAEECGDGTPGWATSGALHVYDFSTKSERFVVDASGLFVLSACRNEHKDRVAIMRHKYFAFGGSYDWYWLYDPKTKKEIGPLGDIDDKNLAKQAEDWCAN